MNDKYVCKSCGSVEFDVRFEGQHTGLYCRHCKKWYKWLSKNEVNIFKDASFRKTKNANGNHIVDLKVILKQIQELQDTVKSMLREIE